MQAAVSYANFGSTGLTTLVGNAGRDFLSFSAAAAGGTYTMPVLTISNWEALPTNVWDTALDLLALSSGAAAGTIVTLNATNRINSFQILSGGLGDDLLDGSISADRLDGRGRANQLNHVTMSQHTVANFIRGGANQTTFTHGAPVMEPLGDCGGTRRAALFADPIQLGSNDFQWQHPQAEAIT